MNKNKVQNSAEKLKEGYLSLIKKISTDDLREMLIVLYSDPKIVVNNNDFDKLGKQEKEDVAKKSAIMDLLDPNKRSKILLILDRDFGVFKEEVIPNPLFEADTDIAKKFGVDPHTPTFPKASLLIGAIKETLNLRETGQELPDNFKINKIECFTSNTSENDYQIVINGEYDRPFAVSKLKKVWKLFFELIENGSLPTDGDAKYLYDLLNFNNLNRLTSNSGYPLQKIIIQDGNLFKPNFKTGIFTHKALIQRQKKTKNST